MSDKLCAVIKELSMMHDRRNERGQEDQSVYEACSAESTDVLRVATECLRSHNARYIMLKSDYMNLFVLMHYEAEICKRIS